MADLKTVLTKIVREMEDEEAKDEVRTLREQLEQGKRVTITDIREAINEAPPEERAQLRELLAEELETPAPAQEPPADEKDKRKPKPKPKPSSDRKTRPGRRSGQAYDWFVDDDGNVVRSNVAVIYSGEDEPDEVEMLPVPDPTEDDDEGGGDAE